MECPLCRKVTRTTSTNKLQTNNDVLTMVKYGDIVSRYVWVGGERVNGVFVV